MAGHCLSPPVALHSDNILPPTRPLNAPHCATSESIFHRARRVCRAADNAACLSRAAIGGGSPHLSRSPCTALFINQLTGEEMGRRSAAILGRSQRVTAGCGGGAAGCVTNGAAGSQSQLRDTSTDGNSQRGQRVDSLCREDDSPVVTSGVSD